jgi:hypothetical protein
MKSISQCYSCSSDFVYQYFISLVFYGVCLLSYSWWLDCLLQGPRMLTYMKTAPIDRIFGHGGLFMRPNRARLAPKVMSHNMWCLPNAIDMRWTEFIENDKLLANISVVWYYYIIDIELVVIWRLYNENYSYLLFLADFHIKTRVSRICCA